jgi:hypothetical protein
VLKIDLRRQPFETTNPIEFLPWLFGKPSPVMPSISLKTKGRSAGKEPFQKVRVVNRCRQSVILLRNERIGVRRATFCWVMTIGEMPMPVVGLMRSELLAGSYIQTFETLVDVQTD